MDQSWVPLGEVVEEPYLWGLSIVVRGKKESAPTRAKMGVDSAVSSFNPMGSTEWEPCAGTGA